MTICTHFYGIDLFSVVKYLAIAVPRKMQILHAPQEFEDPPIEPDEPTPSTERTIRPPSPTKEPYYPEVYEHTVHITLQYRDIYNIL